MGTTNVSLEELIKVGAITVVKEEISRELAKKLVDTIEPAIVKSVDTICKAINDIVK